MFIDFFNYYIACMSNLSIYLILILTFLEYMLTGLNLLVFIKKPTWKLFPLFIFNFLTGLFFTVINFYIIFNYFNG